MIYVENCAQKKRPLSLNECRSPFVSKQPTTTVSTSSPYHVNRHHPVNNPHTSRCPSLEALFLRFRVGPSPPTRNRHRTAGHRTLR